MKRQETNISHEMEQGAAGLPVPVKEAI